MVETMRKVLEAVLERLYKYVTIYLPSLLAALILFLADLKANTHGILSFGGVLSLIVGMAFLINTGPVGLGVNPVVIFGSAAVTFAFFVFFVDRVVRSRRNRVLTGADALLGALGESREDLSPEGLVFVRGALWRAVAQSGSIAAASPVQVVGRSGLRLDVVAAATEVTKER